MTIRTLGELIKSSSENFKDSPALGFVGEKPVTYGEFYKKLNSIIAFLEKLEISKGDKVAILGSNQPNWGITYFALATMGVTIIPILPDFSEGEIENVLRHSEARAIFVSDSLCRKISGLNLPALQFSILLEKFSFIDGKLKSIIPSFKDGEKPIKCYDVQPDDLASIIYTSGTTGKSKGVMLTHRNLVVSAIGSGKIHPMDTTDSMLSVLPLSHTYENTIGLILPMMYGTAVYYLKKPPVPSVLIPAMKDVRPTLMLTVPLIIEKVYKGKVLAEMNSKAITRFLYKVPVTRKIFNYLAGKKLYETFGGRLKFFGIGGAKIAPEVEQFLIEAKFPYAVGYGLTETSPLLAGFDSYHGKYQSTGPVMDGVNLKINNPDSLTGEGEIWAKGEMVMKGYFKEPEITKEVLTNDGWFRTGDLGCLDKGGYLFIKGRLKNMIVGASGENIYPEEIEAIINRFKYVVESVVVQKKGKLVAMVHFNMDELNTKYEYLKEQANQFIDRRIEELSRELQIYVNSQVNKFSRVQLVIVQPEPFEKTATKKIKRFLYY